MAEITVVSGAAAQNTGSLAADNLFYVDDGIVEFSTDGGTTYIPFAQGEKVVFSSGLTVHYRNNNPGPSDFSHMAI